MAVLRDRDVLPALLTRNTRPLLAAFALAFSIFATNRVVLLIVGENEEARANAYMIWLAAFLLIIAAVVDKNRPQRG